MKTFRYLLIAGMAFYVFLFTSVEVISLSKSLYFHEYHKYDVLSLDFVKAYDVDQVTEDIIQYLAGRAENMNRNALFEEREIRHMADVKMLYVLGRRVRLWLLIPLTVMIGWMYREKGFVKRFFLSYGGWIVFLSAILVVGFSNFDKAFLRFHHLFFNNDDWLLDPKKSIIINLMPQGFFADMGKYIVLVFFVINITFLFLIYLMYNAGKMKNKKQSDSIKQ